MTAGVVTLSAVLASTVCANIGAIRQDPAMGETRVVAQTPLEVVSEALSFDCADAEPRPFCAFRAAYRVRNPTDDPQTAAAAFFGVHTSSVEIRQEQRRVAGADGDRVAFELRVAAHATDEVVVTGRMDPGEQVVPSYGIGAARVRHLVLGPADHSRVFTLRYLLAPIRTWHGHPATVRVTLRHPTDWKVRGLVGPSTAEGAHRTIHAQVDLKRVDALELVFERPRPVLQGVGVVLGAGATTTGRLRVFAGYEFEADEGVLWSVCAETDFRRHVAVVPLVQAASASLLGIIPSVSAGVGLPVRMLPDPRVGVRVQAALHWPLLGLAVTVDGYPGDRVPIEVAVVATLGL